MRSTTQCGHIVACKQAEEHVARDCVLHLASLPRVVALLTEQRLGWIDHVLSIGPRRHVCMSEIVKPDCMRVDPDHR